MDLRALLKRFLQPRGAVVDIHARKDAPPNIVTLVSVIFSTKPATFKGPTASLSTALHQSTSSVKLASVRPTSFDGPATSLPSTIARSVPMTSSTSIIPSTTQAPPTVAPIVSSKPTPTPAAKGGMTGGAKAGLAFGIILIILLIVAGAIALYRKRKATMSDGRHRIDDEKTFLEGGRQPDDLPPFATPMQSYPQQHHQPPQMATYDQRGLPARPLSFEAASENLPFATSPSAAPAPQLSLRGVSTFGNSFESEPLANPFEAPANVTASRPATSQANDVNNPFGQHAEQISQAPPVANNERISVPPPNAADFPMPDNTPETHAPVSPIPEASVPAPMPTSAPLPVSAPVTASEPKTSRHASLTDSAAIMAATTAAAAIKPRSGASTPAGPPPDTVYRVQLDFKPNMPDELGIAAGQLVRILHEYDDGWVSYQNSSINPN